MTTGVLTNAEKECDEWISINHKGVLRSVGEVFTEIHDPPSNSTESRSSKYTYEVVSHEKIFKYRKGNKAYFEWAACVECSDIKIIESGSK